MSGGAATKAAGAAGAEKESQQMDPKPTHKRTPHHSFEAARWRKYVSPYKDQPSQDVMHVLVLLSAMGAFFFRSIALGWVAIFCAASGLANHKYSGDYSSFTQVPVAVLATVMAYMHKTRLDQE
ncbi:hypothetical protein PTSG_12501 [Salpingoeca rosetta]|uniref:Uncharacterized protein n=1 Tax=Salpingoeca rosetta (strain ATCC 50818 / BSB-021) TaxID=946362 RepID=F2UF28_SALR5|nr:uncharacterized protein PTSG_12501 [Salpingoeca rosetta]EGD75228.1 hypothetical protein PTSG_12501 [Salpingoeca rosetta]|eukprot:XP_004992281.1 hypothetical protein PTSG_12501 [Salpingoeca rosetta]